jgi:hypothetical protein
MADWTLVEHLTNWLERPRFGDSKHPTLWPSEASAVIKNEHDEEVVVGKCRRATFFRYATSCYKFYPKYAHLRTLIDELEEKKIPVDRYMRWIWVQGELYEEYIINAAKASGVYIADQSAIYVAECNVSGKLDVVVINPLTHKYSITEVKSVYGFGANFVLGTPSARRKHIPGTPRDSNLMQIAIYDWWTASQDDNFEDSRLLYGARDTGRYSEYRVRTAVDEDGLIKIYYSVIAPFKSEEIESPITINSILIDGYKYVEDHIQAGDIPPRDFDIKYSEERIQTLWKRGELGKGDSDKLQKIEDRKKENEQRELDGLAPKKELKGLEKGDWNCNFCSFKNFCYDSDGNPRKD